MKSNETAFHHSAGGEPLLHDARPHRKGGEKKSTEATKYVSRRLPGTTQDDEFIRDDAHFKPPSVNAMSGAGSGGEPLLHRARHDRKYGETTSTENTKSTSRRLP